ncbi:hypothetical protein [Chryseobacterium polytrichastri]|uniref:Uncharacterized protein n=1 Tax=Chryseobacterium polytrichastri TaxID=1302687 RepID=A0A1M6VXF0_9FLAO|nr:hypothetical protein [Chryseobacterium polytrichastri]SHK86005.1 hypothetical protein SAMN05444267_1008169 [Chryseobacterium polytrichastri]
MPIIRSSDQKNKRLEEFYKELTSDNATMVENEIGKVMFDFISMVNETFIKTTLYGLTSHYSLLIQATDSWEDGWFVRVYSIGDKKFQFEYKMSKNQSPWNYAVVKGQANTIYEAKDFLIIAMTESEGWSDNKELRKLYNKLKDRKTEKTKFTLWLEFEEFDSTNWDKENEFCNIHVDLEDGRHYGLNVWTYSFLETAISEDEKTGQNLSGLYQKPPDLFVKELTRECIQQTIEDLLKMGNLEKVLNPSIYDKQQEK